MNAAKSETPYSFCWFCQSPHNLMKGHSLFSMIESDYRRDCSVHEEFMEYQTLQTSLVATICKECYFRFRTYCKGANSSYLNQMQLLNSEMHSEQSDVESGIISNNERVLAYGCWFGVYPRAAETKIFQGMTLIDIYRCGIDPFGNFTTSKHNFDRFVKNSSWSTCSEETDVHEVLDATNNIHLSDGLFDADDRTLLCNITVHVSDVFLMMNEFSPDS